MPKRELIETRQEDGIAWIRLNRPDVLNALNRQLISEIVAEMESCDRDDDVKVIVLTGNGRAFAAGADIGEMAAADAVSMDMENQFAEWDRLLQIKKPVIAAVNGFAFGGGFELALACDLRFASENAQFGFPEIKLGVMPGAGGTQWLTKYMGKAKALEWLWSGEPMKAKEAERFGIVNRLVAPELLEEETKKFAQKLARQPLMSLRLIKEAVAAAVDSTIADGMKYERKNFYMLFATEDQKEGMKAFAEKRKPNFKDR